MASSVSPINDSSRIFDNGPGTGMLTSVILEQYPLASITAADVSSGMIGGLKANNWKTVNTLVADASDLRAARLEDQTFTHSMGTFFLPFVPYPQQVIAEMSRVTQPGGVVAVSTWSRISWVTPWTEARRTIEPDYIAPPLFHTGTTEREDVEDLFNKAGLSNVSVKAVECPHPKKASVDEAVDQFYNMGNPSVHLLQRGLSEAQLTEIKPVFARAYAKKFDGVEKPQVEVAILAVGQRPHAS